MFLLFSIARTVRVHKGRVKNGHQEHVGNDADVATQALIRGGIGRRGALNGGSNGGALTARVCHYHPVESKRAAGFLSLSLLLRC